MMKLKPLKEFLPKNKRGQIGFNLVVAIFIVLMTLVVVGISTILVGTSLRDSKIFTSYTAEYNQTNAIVANTSSAVSSFFGNISTILAIVVVVIIILAIAIVIRVVRGFGGGARSL